MLYIKLVWPWGRKAFSSFTIFKWCRHVRQNEMHNFPDCLFESPKWMVLSCRTVNDLWSHFGGNAMRNYKFRHSILLLLKHPLCHVSKKNYSSQIRWMLAVIYLWQQYQWNIYAKWPVLPANNWVSNAISERSGQTGWCWMASIFDFSKYE